MDVKEAIRAIVFERNMAFGIIAEVLSVSGTTCSVAPVDGSADINNVRLQTAAASGILCVPSVGSFVVVQMINDVEGVVVMFSEIDSIKFLDGSHGGLVRVIDLVSRINGIENKVNSIISHFSGLTAGGDPVIPAFTGGSLTNTTRDQIENDKITHGTV